MKFGRETNALNVLAILNSISVFSNEEKSIGESLRDWLSCKEDYSITTRAHIAAVMELSIEDLNVLFGLLNESDELDATDSQSDDTEKPSSSR